MKTNHIMLDKEQKHLIESLKQKDGYEFECNMDKSFGDYDTHDEWGCAYLWLNDMGVEYNFFAQGKQANYSAIYKMEYDKSTQYWDTETDIYEHYEIDFNKENWQLELENAMCKALIQFFELDKFMEQKDFWKLCLQERNKLKMEDNIKVWELAIQCAIGIACKGKQWYEVTRVSIYTELLSGKRPIDVCNKVWNDVSKHVNLSKEYSQSVSLDEKVKSAEVKKETGSVKSKCLNIEKNL